MLQDLNDSTGSSSETTKIPRRSESIQPYSMFFENTVDLKGFTDVMRLLTIIQDVLRCHHRIFRFYLKRSETSIVLGPTFVVFEMLLSQGLVEDRIRLRLELLFHHPQIITKAATSRRREEMPHLMLLEHSKQRLDQLGSHATNEEATKRERTGFVVRVEAQRRGTVHFHNSAWKLPSVDVSDPASSARATNGSDSLASSASLRDYVSGYCSTPGPRTRGGGGAPGAQKITQGEDLA